MSFTLKKRDTIIVSVRSRIARTTHKYEIKISISWKHSKEIDVRNKNHLWETALAKKIKMWKLILMFLRIMKMFLLAGQKRRDI